MDVPQGEHASSLHEPMGMTPGKEAMEMSSPIQSPSEADNKPLAPSSATAHVVKPSPRNSDLEEVTLNEASADHCDNGSPFMLCLVNPGKLSMHTSMRVYQCSASVPQNAGSGGQAGQAIMRKLQVKHASPLAMPAHGYNITRPYNITLETTSPQHTGSA